MEKTKTKQMGFVATEKFYNKVKAAVAKDPENRSMSDFIRLAIMKEVRRVLNQ